MPVISLAEKNKIKECDALQFVKTYNEAILKFQVNISIYLVLQNSNVNLATHPIVKRLYQWKQLFMKMDPIFEDKIKFQLEKLLENIVSFDSVSKIKMCGNLKLLTENEENFESFIGEKIKIARTTEKED